MHPMGESNIFPKRGGYSTLPPPPHLRPKAHDARCAQHIQPNLIFLNLTYFITIIVNLIGALGLRIDFNT